MSASFLASLALRLSLALACPCGSLVAQDERPPLRAAPEGQDVSAAPEVPLEYQGFSQPRVDDALATELAAADKAIKARDWKEAVKILNHVLGPAREAAALPRVDAEGDRFLTTDHIRFTSAGLEVSRRIEKLPQEGLAIWQEKRKSSQLADTNPAPGAPRVNLDGTCVLGRADHAAFELSPDAEWRPGGYARWIHPLTNPRALTSSVPAKNAYYAYAPMQLVFWGDLVMGRSHQDLIALDRVTGEVRWRVETDVPEDEQTHVDSKSGGLFDSWRYFSDVGGWQLTVLGGQPSAVVILDKPGRASMQNGKLSFRRNLLRAYDTVTGQRLWQRGGAEDPDEALRALTFVAPPVVVDGKGDAVVVPATSDEGFHAVGMTRSGRLLWSKRIYTYAPECHALIGNSMSHGAALAASDGIVVGAPGQGLVFAVTAQGETLWQTRYPSNIRLTPNSPRWAPGHPILSAGKVIAAPFDADGLLVYEARTGALVWSKRFLGGYHALVGADGSKVYKIDEAGRVTAYLLGEGTAEWTSEPLGPPTGRAIVTSGRIHVALQRSILLLDTGKGTLLKRVKIWDDRLLDPSPGNLFFSRGELFFGTAWGYAKLEAYEETLASLGSFEIRGQLLRKAMVSHALGNHGEALNCLKKLLASTSEDTIRDSLRSELLQIAQEAVSSTKDRKFIQHILSEPDLLPSKAHRTAFVMRSAELLEKESVADAVKLYREAVDDASPDDVFLSPHGVYVDVEAYASESLRSLATSDRAEARPDEDERVARAVKNAVESLRPLERLQGLWLKHSHSRSSALAGASLFGMARAAQDSVATENIAERLSSEDARLASLRFETTVDASEHSLPPRSWNVSAPWTRRFLGKAKGAELVSTAPGSDALSGMLIAREGKLVLLDDDGKVLWKHERSETPNLTEAREEFPGSVLEPSMAHRRGDRTLVFTRLGLTELVGLVGEPEKARLWLSLRHPLDQREDAANAGEKRTVRIVRGNTMITRRERLRPEAKAAAEKGANYFPCASFDEEGNPMVAEPNGTLLVFERHTGRLVFRDEVADTTASGQPVRTGGLITLECARPASVIVRDPRSRARLNVPASSPPWRSILVPGLAIVTDSQAGIQVRLLPMLAGLPLDEGAASRFLWRDAKPRGLLALAHADSSQVIASEPGGKLMSRSLQSGRPRWSVPFPDSASPVALFELGGQAGEPGDLVIAASRGFDPDSARDHVGGKTAQNLHFVRVSRSGQKLWEVQVADGSVAYGGSRLFAPSGEWIVILNQKAKEWKTVAMLLDPVNGSIRTLFELDLEPKPSYPPPKVCSTERGIAVGNGSAWALFSP